MLSSFSILSLNMLWVHSLYSEFNMNRLSFSWIYYDTINFFVNKLSIHYVSFICIANPLWVQYLLAISLEIHDLFCKFTTGILFAIRLIFSQNHCKFNISSMNFLYFLHNIIRVFTLFSLLFANSLWINYLFHEKTKCFAKSLWIHYLCREFTINPLFFRVFTMSLPSFSRIYYQLTINFANKL